MNLLTETLDAITNSGHTPDDIIFIGSESSGHSCTWDEYTRLADRNYDDGYGGVEVATDLVIVFADHQKMWRGEADGGPEWWEFSTPFNPPTDQKPITTLFGYWSSLADVNNAPA